MKGSHAKDGSKAEKRQNIKLLFINLCDQASNLIVHLHQIFIIVTGAEGTKDKIKKKKVNS